MNRFRTPLLILGIVLALIVGASVFVVIRVGRGTPVQLPVAVADIPPGTPLEPQDFRLEEVRGQDEGTLEAYITADEFGLYVGYPVMEMIHAGFPVGKAQVLTDAPNARQSHLTLLLTDTQQLVYPLPVTADQVGNFIVPGDRIDVIFSVGRVAANEIAFGQEVAAPDLSAIGGASAVTTTTGTTETVPIAPVVPPDTPRVGDVITTTLLLPLSKVILPDLLVLRVEREQIRAASASYGLSGDSSSQQPIEGDILRLYLVVDREQAEVLSFALHNGSLNLPARAVPAGGQSEGFTWDDFVKRFFTERSLENGD